MIIMMTMMKEKNRKTKMETKMEMEKEEKEMEMEMERESGEAEGEGEANTDIDPRHLCPFANHSRDHNRLPVPRSKQALSRRLQVQHPQKNLLDGQTLWSRRVERDREKKRAREPVITSGAQNGRLWRARTPSICE